MIIQGDGLVAAEKVFFGDQEASFDVDGLVLVVASLMARARST